MESRNALPFSNVIFLTLLFIIKRLPNYGIIIILGEKKAGYKMVGFYKNVCNGSVFFQLACPISLFIWESLIFSVVDIEIPILKSVNVWNGNSFPENPFLQNHSPIKNTVLQRVHVSRNHNCFKGPNRCKALKYALFKYSFY